MVEAIESPKTTKNWNNPVNQTLIRYAFFWLSQAFPLNQSKSQQKVKVGENSLYQNHQQSFFLILL